MSDYLIHCKTERFDGSPHAVAVAIPFDLDAISEHVIVRRRPIDAGLDTLFDALVAELVEELERRGHTLVRTLVERPMRDK